MNGNIKPVNFEILDLENNSFLPEFPIYYLPNLEPVKYKFQPGVWLPGAPDIDKTGIVLTLLLILLISIMLSFKKKKRKRRK